MPVANKIQAEELRAELAALGSAIVIPAASYPDGSDITPIVQQFLEATARAQIAQNEFANTGEDVSLITKASGATVRYEYPAGSGTNYDVVPTVYTAVLNLVTSVSNALPPLT